MIKELRALWRFYSVKLAALAGLIVAWLLSDPTLIPRLLAALPADLKPAAPFIAGFVAFTLPVLARRLPQPPKDDQA